MKHFKVPPIKPEDYADIRGVPVPTNRPEDASALSGRFPQHMLNRLPVDLEAYILAMLEFYDMDKLTFLTLSQDAKIALSIQYQKVKEQQS